MTGLAEEAGDNASPSALTTRPPHGSRLVQSCVAGRQTRPGVGQAGHAWILSGAAREQEADLQKKQQQSRPQAAGQALRMLAAYMDAYTEATIEGGGTKASVEMRGLRVETKINLSGTTEVPHARTRGSVQM